MAVFVMLSGCVSGQPLGGSPDITIAGDALPAPTAVDLVGTARPYLIGPFDRLVIDVFGVEEMSKREVQADAGGNISFPLVGAIRAAGLTPLELADALEASLRGRFIRDPQVTVNLTETFSQVVTVDGQVTEPGLYPVIGSMSLMQAVARAKGVSQYADLQDVVIFRSVGGQKMAGLYNLQAIRRGAYGDPEVFANDIVVVGDSASRRLIEKVIQLAPLLTTPIVLLLQK